MTPSEALSRFRGSQKLDPLSWFMRISLGITRSRIKGHPIKMELRYSCFRDSARKKKLRYFCSTVDHSVLLLEVIFLRRVTLHCREFPRWESLKFLYSIHVNHFEKQWFQESIFTFLLNFQTFYKKEDEKKIFLLFHFDYFSKRASACIRMFYRNKIRLVKVHIHSFEKVSFEKNWFSMATQFRVLWNIVSKLQLEYQPQSLFGGAIRIL